MSFALKELRAKSDEEIITLHDQIAKLDDQIAKHAIEKVHYYLNELTRRDQSRQTEAILSYTRRITWMTGIVVLATILNLVITFLLLYKC